LCASAFNQNGITYYDCTNTVSPDGSNKKQEWCYIDVNSQDEVKEWDYCKPIINYDKLREENQHSLDSITQEARKVNADLDQALLDGEFAINNIKDIKDGHASLDALINKMQSELQTMFNNIDYLKNVSKEWEDKEKEALSTSDKISDYEKKSKANSNKKENKEYVLDDEKNILIEQKKNFMTINPIFQRKELLNKISCEGLQDYLQAKDGDGLIGEYYDNENWVGNSIQKIDENVNFNWNSISPIKGINPYNYSICWTGFIKAPFSGEYQFHIFSKDGALLTINGNVEVIHNMQTAYTESKKRNDIWLKTEVGKLKYPNKDHKLSSSKSINLIGGKFYKYINTYYYILE